MDMFGVDAGRLLNWRCNACGRDGSGVVAWPEHERSCAPYRAWIALLRHEAASLDVGGAFAES